MNNEQHLPETGITHAELNIVCGTVWDDPKATPVADILAAWQAGMARFGLRFDVARAHPATIRVLMRARDTQLRVGMGRVVRGSAFWNVSENEPDPTNVFRALMRAVFDDPDFKVLADYDYPIGELLLFDTTDSPPVNYARLRAM